MAHDKRADISVAMPARKILCELKRDYHTDVWTAADHQLERFYTHDPEAHGFGVYVVFWFGDKRPAEIPAPPGGKERPRSTAEMERMLSDLVPPERRGRIVVRVIDVSGQLPPVSKPSRAGRRKKKPSPGVTSRSKSQTARPRGSKATRKHPSKPAKKKRPAKSAKKKKARRKAR